LRGKLPFDSESERELTNLIISGDIEYDDAWRGLSDECSNFVKKLLTRDTKERMSSTAALEHPWIIKNREVIPL
jgi:serine/threonine protein kinase